MPLFMPLIFLSWFKLYYLAINLLSEVGQSIKFLKKVTSMLYSRLIRTAKLDLFNSSIFLDLCWIFLLCFSLYFFGLVLLCQF